MNRGLASCARRAGLALLLSLAFAGAARAGGRVVSSDVISLSGKVGGITILPLTVGSTS